MELCEHRGNMKNKNWLGVWSCEETSLLLGFWLLSAIFLSVWRGVMVMD